MVTLKDVAQRVGVSIRAVSHAVNRTGRLAPETREKILTAIREMGYYPNQGARELVTRKSKLIGVLTPSLSISFYARIISGIQQVAYQENYTLLLMSPLGEKSDDYQFLCTQMLQRRVDGIILNPIPSVRNIAKFTRSCGIPVIQIQNHIDSFGSDYVQVANAESAKEAVYALYRSGCRKIAMVSHSRICEEIADRETGFLAAMKEMRPDYKPVVMESSVEIPDAKRVVGRMLAEHPEIDAIFAASDYAGLGAAQAALELGRRIPEDLSIIGFDNLEIAAQQLVYPLSTVDQPKEEIGRIAMKMMIDRLNGRPTGSRVLPASLILRSTTRAEKNAKHGLHTAFVNTQKRRIRTNNIRHEEERNHE